MCKHEMYVFRPFPTLVFVLTYCLELVTFIGAAGYVANWQCCCTSSFMLLITML